MATITAEKILEVAELEFAEKGFEGTSMRQLADRLSVTPAALYRYFASKEDIFEEVCEYVFDEIVATAAEAASHGAEDALEDFVLGLFDIWSANKSYLLLSQRDVIASSINAKHAMTSSRYVKLSTTLATILHQQQGCPTGEALCFTITAFLFGYIQLVNYQLKTSGDLPADYLASRRRELLTSCRHLLQAERVTPKKVVVTKIRRELAAA